MAESLLLRPAGPGEGKLRSGVRGKREDYLPEDRAEGGLGGSMFGTTRTKAHIRTNIKRYRLTRA